MRKRENRKLIPIIRIICVFAVILFLSTIFALIYATGSNIINHVSIEEIEVSGLTRNKAEEELQEEIDKILDGEIKLKYGENEKTFTLRRIEMQTDITEKANEAFKIGRDKNIFLNNYKIIAVLINGENIKLNVSFNDDVLQSFLSNLDEEWTDKFIDNSYYIDDDKLIIVRGKIGTVIDEEALKEKIENVVHDKIQGKEVNEIEIPVITKEPDEIDLEQIRNEIYKEAQNASYDEQKKVLSVHVDGVDFNIDDAKTILSEEKDEYIIPLTITKPEVTTDMLGEEAFPDVLGEAITRYSLGNENRNTNMELAAEAINGTVIMPGERFSFNAIVGPTTAGKGYKLAGAYSAGELVENYGGGICQVSSTLYNAVLKANLGIVERYNHSSVVSYLDPGKDATISYGSKDFKFENTRDYAIKINAKAKNGVVEMQIKGILQDEEYEIDVTSETKEIIVCDTKYIYDSTLKDGEEVVESSGANGAKSITYKVTKKNGAVLKKEVLSEDTYNPMVRVVRTGSKK